MLVLYFFFPYIESMRKRPARRRRWRYKNLTMVAAGLILSLLLAQVEAFHSFLLHLGGWGYLGAFIAGMLFVSTFTVATSALILFILAETLSPLEIGLVAGLGSVVGDLLIFHLVRDNLSVEIRDLYNHFDHNHHLKKIFQSRYFSWTLPVMGSVLIASPLPDELGMSLLGLSQISTVRLVVLSYVLNSVGIFLIVSAAVVVR